MNDKSEKKKKFSDIFSRSFFSDNKKKKDNEEEELVLEIRGGPLQTDLIIAELKNSKGEIVELNAKWFTTGHNQDVESNEENGVGYYQPCADDIGKKLEIIINI